MIHATFGLSDLRAQIQRHILERPQYVPEFSYEIAIGKNYEDLLEGKVIKSSTAQLFETAKKQGRLLISARAGGAKTVLFHRFTKLLAAKGALPILVELKRWSESDTTRWDAFEAPGDRMNYILTKFGLPAISVLALDAMPPEIPRFVLIDGLNEVPHNIVPDIIDATDDFASFASNASVILSDRLTRRSLKQDERWLLATILPLRDSEIRNLLKAKGHDYDSLGEPRKELLRTPYFLNAYLIGNAGGRNSSEEIGRFFRDKVTSDQTRLAQIDEAAFKMYETFKSRSFPLASFAEIAGKSNTEKLAEVGALLRRNGNAYFDHHLKHDYLVARYLADKKTLWRHSAFNIATFGANSFDVLAMVLQQQHNEEDADHFFREVYDWNLYGAAYAVTEGRRYEDSTTAITAESEHLILAMLAIRRWDIIEATRIKAEDALRLFPGEKANKYLIASSWREIRDIVSELHGKSDLFRRWREMFISESITAAVDDPIALLGDSDSIIGWTIANLLRTQTVNMSDCSRLLKSLTSSQSEVVRWRSAYVLGACQNIDVADALFEQALRDNDVWVRYGITRSLVELAATGDVVLRSHVFSKFSENHAWLLRDEKSLNEFRSAIFIDPRRASNDWLEAVGPVIDTLYLNDPKFERKAEWLAVMQSLRARYGARDE